MPNYDFTVRATDNLGAYSDRTFTISVKNTNVERFCVVGDAGLIHSPTGAGGSWITEAGVTGVGVNYGNGQWVVWDGATTIRTSFDAVNWASYTVNLPATSAYPGGTLTNVSMIKYRKQRWSLFAAFKYADDTYRTLEYTSLDLINWTATGRQVGPNATAATRVNDVEYDAVSDRWVVESAHSTSGHILSSRTGSGDYSVVYTATNALGRLTMGAVINLNGLWCAHVGNTLTAGVAVSADGINWGLKTVATQSYFGGGMAYANGRLLFQQRGTSTTTQYASLNGGRTWVASGSYTTVTTPATAVQTIGAYGNIAIGITGNSNQLAVSTNNGASWATSTISNSFGTPMAIATRDD